MVLGPLPPPSSPLYSPPRILPGKDGGQGSPFRKPERCLLEAEVSAAGLQMTGARSSLKQRGYGQEMGLRLGRPPPGPASSLHFWPRRLGLTETERGWPLLLSSEPGDRAVRPIPHQLQDSGQHPGSPTGPTVGICRPEITAITKGQTRPQHRCAGRSPQNRGSLGVGGGGISA